MNAPVPEAEARWLALAVGVWDNEGGAAAPVTLEQRDGRNDQPTRRWPTPEREP